MRALPTTATLLIAALATALAGCGTTSTDADAALSPSASAPVTSAAAEAPPGAATGDAAELLAAHGLTGKTGRQIVDALDRDPSPRPLSLTGSVRPTQLVLSDGAREASLPLPGDSFYLSVAPFVSRTHECFHHNLGTCQGELSGRPVHVTITDAAGATLVDRDETTYANGFVGFWVPAGTSGTITVTHDGKTGSVPFSTGAQSPTCLTTLRLT